ncbi:MAG: RNA polymerase sigma factor [Bacillota bacterium]
MAVAAVNAGQGSQAMFEDVFSAYRKRVYGYALRLVGDPHDAEDVTQETFLKLYRSMHTFRGECSIETWVFRITANACVDSLRSSRRREVLCLDGQRDQEAPVPQLVGSAPDPAEVAEGVDIREGVVECLNRLERDQRKVLVLREVRDLSYTDISREMGCPLGTVKSKLNRARAALKRAVTENLTCL